jgi:hypothetical protein
MAVTSPDFLNPNTSWNKQVNRNLAFQELARKTCKVVWTVGQEIVETSGCFINDYSPKKIQVLSCFHDDSWAKATAILIIYQDKKINAKLDPTISMFQARRHDLCVLDFEHKDAEYDYFDFKQGFTQPSLGQKIYFAGFPFGTNNPIVHKGYVSSAHIRGGSDQFTIDGTIVRGHSGGPIVVARTTELLLLGIISSQLCDISKKFTELSNAELPHIVPINDVAPSYGDSDMRAVLKETMDCIFANFSTGIGKATCLTKIALLKEEKTEVSEEEEQTTFTTSGTEKFTSLPSSTNSGDTSASTVFADMQRPDLWMQRRGIGGNSSLVSEIGNFDRTSYGEEPTELAVGKKNRDEKNKKKLKAEARQVRAEAKENGSFQNNGVPATLYRFVSTEAAKAIKKNGIVHTGTELDEIPFITKPEKGIYPFHLKATQENRIEISLKSNKKTRSILT